MVSVPKSPLDSLYNKEFSPHPLPTGRQASLSPQEERTE